MEQLDTRLGLLVRLLVTQPVKSLPVGRHELVAGSGCSRLSLRPRGKPSFYRRKIEKLTEALNKEELRAEAAEILRSTIQTIRLVPKDGELTIELVGELAGILALRQEKGPRPFFGPGAR